MLPWQKVTNAFVKVTELAATVRHAAQRLDVHLMGHEWLLRRIVNVRSHHCVPCATTTWLPVSTASQLPCVSLRALQRGVHHGLVHHIMASRARRNVHVCCSTRRAEAANSLRSGHRQQWTHHQPAHGRPQVAASTQLLSALHSTNVLLSTNMQVMRMLWPSTFLYHQQEATNFSFAVSKPGTACKSSAANTLNI